LLTQIIVSVSSREVAFMLPGVSYSAWKCLSQGGMRRDSVKFREQKGRKFIVGFICSTLRLWHQEDCDGLDICIIRNGETGNAY
jgi:hypothetical protein